MKIVAINGSPKGKMSNTNVMVTAFLKGAEAAGAETVNILLGDKNIEYCRGCYTCWTKTPGKCATDDDMTEVLSLLAGSNVIVLATPLYFNNVSGTLKVFMDRLAPLGNPLSRKAGTEQNQQSPAPKLVMMSNCGYSDRSQFEVVSLWIKTVARMMQTEVVAEIYATHGWSLSSPKDEMKPVMANYLHLLETAGNEIASGMKLSETTERLLTSFPPPP